MKGRRYRIWKLILSTAVALTMLPVQARAEGCSHTLTYSAEGNVLIETCTQNCGHSAQAKLVLDEEVPLVYTGGEIRPLKVEASKKTEATETEKALEDWLGGELTIVYENNINASTGEVKASGSIFKEIDGPENTKETIKAVMTFSIAKAENPVKVSDYAGTYDGQFHGIIMDGIPNDMVIEFSDAEDGVYSELPPTLTDVGDLTVWYKLTADNYESMSGSASISITPRELTVSAQAETVYGDAAPDMEAVYEGFAEGEDASRLTGEPVLAHAYVPFMDAGSYEIQVSAEGIHAVNYTVTAKNGSLTVKPRELTVTPDATTFAYDGEAHKPAVTVAGIVNQDDIQWTVEGEAIDAGTYTAKVSISGEKSGNYSLPNNGELSFTIRQAEQAAPTGLEAVHESIWNRGDGKITGVTAEMEYKREGTEEYIPVSGTQITGLTSGTYLVRYAEKTPNYAASPDMKVTVAAEEVLTVGVPAEQVGYTLTVDHTEVGWNGESKLTFQLLDGYSKTEDFAVKVADKAITLEADGTYTIRNIQESKRITVEGVVDQTAPVVMITLTGKNTSTVTRSSTTLTDNITFEDFFKEIKVEIVGTDASGTPSIEYYEASEKVEDVSAISDWKPYTGTYQVSGNNRDLVIYVRVTDSSGNAAYASTNGVVYDTVAPVIDIRGGENYTTLTIAAEDITETNLDRIEVNGVKKALPATLEGNVTKIYRLIAYDKAGNKSTTKTVNMYPISRLDDTIAELTADNVTSGDKTAIQTVRNKVKAADGTEAEEALLKPIEDRCDMLLAVIEIKEIAKPIDSLTKDNMKPENKETVQKVQTAIERKTGKTDEEKALLSEIEEKCEELLENVNYSITSEDADLQWVKSSGKDLKIKTDAGNATLKNVRIDDKILAKTNYKYEDGILTLYKSYLQKTTTTVGKHTIQLEYEDGETDGEDEIQIFKAGTNPKTGDGSHIVLWCLTAGFSAAGLTTAALAGRKRRYRA